MKTHKQSLCLSITVCVLSFPLLAAAKTPAPDLVIEKTTQTSSTFWVVRVKNTGKGDSAATTLKMVATPGGSYSCPVSAIKAGGTAEVPCRMPFKAREGMRCEFIVNPDKSVAESSYANNRTASLTNPKFN
jgi:CARDB protein